MSQKQQCKLNTPAKKFFACQLLQCSPCRGVTTDQWSYHGNGSAAPNFSQVWLQGTVVLVSADGSDLLLDDGTGIIQANGVTKIVKDLFICKGMYVMVAGQLNSIGSANHTQYPTIKVLKVADLSNNPHCEALWMLEVVDAQLAAV